MKSNNLKGSIILVLASLIWGLAFVVQNDANRTIKPFALNGIRSLLGACIIGLYLFIKRQMTQTPVFKNTKEYKRAAVLGGIVCGLLLALAVNFQQLGIAAYPKGAAIEARAGFLTALYVILVPIVSVFFKRKTSAVIWLSVLIATAGVYLLCLTGGMTGIYLGDVLMFLCAFSFTFHILCVDKFGKILGGPQLSMIQFIVCGIISSIISLIVEPDMGLNNIYLSLPQLLYMGIMSSGIAYTLQIVGQRYAEPAVASISMSLESVFATLGGWIIMGNALTIREFFGCVLVFIAIIIAQLPEMMTKKTEGETVCPECQEEKPL